MDKHTKLHNVRNVLVAGGLIVTLGVSGLITQVYAEVKPEETPRVEQKSIELDTTKVLQESEIVSSAETLQTGAKNLTQEAVNLNSSILEEIEHIREERRLEEERIKQEQEKAENNLVDFITSAKSHKFANYDIRTKSNLTGDQLEKAVEGTGLAGLGDAYAEAEQTYGVNALMLVGLSALESSWGESNIAKTKNNLFGYQAYDSNTDAARVFDSREEAIMVVANHLSKNYLQEGAMYHNGYTLEGVNVKYSSDKSWAGKITSIMSRLVDTIE